MWSVSRGQIKALVAQLANAVDLKSGLVSSRASALHSVKTMKEMDIQNIV